MTSHFIYVTNHSPYTHTSLIDVTMLKSKANTGGLVEELQLAIGAKVMLVVNIDVSESLSMGQLEQ